MKNQFVCDERDYHKYGLIRQISDNTSVRIGVCWMLTPDEDSNDGCKTKYLMNPKRWRHYDPELYDCLKRIYEENSEDSRKHCTVDHIAESGILPVSKFHNNISDVLTDTTEVDLIFFDPDVGLMPQSGCKEPEKYMSWKEAIDIYKNMNKSMLIFQFLHGGRRNSWQTDIQNKCSEIKKNAGAGQIYSFLTESVVFLLVPNEKHVDKFKFDALKNSLEATWRDRIRMQEWK